jgi:hypothetical protein
MSILLEAITFNHDPNAATTDALNIRRNATQMVSLPEWQRGVSVNPEDSPAAYAIQETAGQTLTIHAQFRSTDPAIQTAEVRAIDPNLAQGCIYAILVSLGIIPFVRPAGANVLGEVRAHQVTFLPSGETGSVSFDLQNVQLVTAGVGVHTVTWHWQYRLSPSGTWIDFATSTHRVYSLLETPTAPWQQTPYQVTNQQLPWTEVLDYACNWAAGASTRDGAAAEVTRAVYDLGPAIVEYDCPGGGATHYALSAFNCTAFLERLRGGIGNGRYVNCTDCATILSTFANSLGCDLWQSRMGTYVVFGLNPIRAIGHTIWYPGCQNWSGTGFSYHEVAWKGACTANEEVFDGCLQVDGDADPTAAPQTPLLPINIRFGNPGDGQYRDRLATPAGRVNCVPTPGTRQRRSII